MSGFKLVRKRYDWARDERGATLAELAILLPVLVVMIAASAELGRYFQTYATLSKATRSAARYLSNHKFEDNEKDRARNLVICGKLTCNTGDELVKNFSLGNHVCIESTGAPVLETVTVRIPRQGVNCDGGAVAPFNYQPVFDIGALLGNSFSLNLPISPSTTMHYMELNPPTP